MSQNANVRKAATETNLERRKRQWSEIQHCAADVIIVGGGINGASIFHHLCNAGYRVLLVEKGDFASGTSQASAMMIWGGLIHLRQLGLMTVGRLCASREHLIREKSDSVRPRAFRYLPTRESGRKPFSAYTAHYSYWLLGGARRKRPRLQRDFTELSFLNRQAFNYSLEYEEACVEPSDARFVLEWLLPHQNSSNVALNYCTLRGGLYDDAAKEWRLELHDSICETEATVRAKWVVNAAGTWTDTVNQRFNIGSPYKHVFGKGVFIGLKRYPQHDTALMIETKALESCMSLIPWGSVSLWGPTETCVTDIEAGFCATPEDVRYLIQQLNKHLSRPVTLEEIVSLRCGVRPLAVKRSFRETDHTLNLSRKYRIHLDRDSSWISIYGGKLTGCVPLAKQVAKLLRRRLKPKNDRYSNLPMSEAEHTEFERFPSLAEKVPSADWCAEREMCWSLEDYLRRRTNISQWVARGGLGLRNENAQHLKVLAKVFHGDDERCIDATVRLYERKIEREFDDVLANAF